MRCGIRRARYMLQRPSLYVEDTRGLFVSEKALLERYSTRGKRELRQANFFENQTMDIREQGESFSIIGSVFSNLFSGFTLSLPTFAGAQGTESCDEKREKEIKNRDRDRDKDGERDRDRDRDRGRGRDRDRDRGRDRDRSPLCGRCVRV